MIVSPLVPATSQCQWLENHPIWQHFLDVILPVLSNTASDPVIFGVKKWHGKAEHITQMPPSGGENYGLQHTDKDCRQRFFFSHRMFLQQ